MLDRKKNPTPCFCVQDTHILLAVPAVGWILLPQLSLWARQRKPEMSTVQGSLERQRGHHAAIFNTLLERPSRIVKAIYYLTCPF